MKQFTNLLLFCITLFCPSNVNAFVVEITKPPLTPPIHDQTSGGDKAINPLHLAVVHQQNKDQELQLCKASAIMSTEWEAGILASTTVVGVIGDLALMGAHHDFELKTANMRREKLQATMFRPAIFELALSTTGALNKASQNSLAMQTQMGTIGPLIFEVLRTLQTGTAEDIVSFLPTPLKLLNGIVKKSIETAKSTDATFSATMQLLNEIALALAITKSDNEMKIKELKTHKKLVTQQLQQEKEIIETLNRTKHELSESLKDAQKKFDEALQKIPTGWSAVGQAFVANLNLGDILLKVGEVAMMMTPEGMAASAVGGVVSDLQDKKTSEQTAYHTSSNMANGLNHVAENIESAETAIENAEDQPAAQQNLTTYADVCTDMTNVLKNVLKTKLGTSVKNETMKLLNSTVGELKQLKDQAFSKIKKKLNLEGPKKALAKLQSSFLAIATAGSVKNGQSTMKSQFGRSQDGYQVGSNERQIAALRNAQLLDSKHALRDKENQILEAVKDANKLMTELSRIKIEKLDVNQTLTYIRRAVVELTKLKQMWRSMLDLFNTMTIYLEDGMTTFMGAFTGYAATDVSIIANKKNNKSIESSIANSRLSLLENGEKSVVLASAIKMISSLYYNVSKKYVLEECTNIANLIDSEEEDLPIKANKLMSNSNEAQEYVEKMAKEHTQKYFVQAEQLIKQAADIFKVVGIPTKGEKHAISIGQHLAKTGDYAKFAEKYGI